MSSFEESYMGQLRKLVGNRRLISTGARAIICDGQGRVLFIRRKDNGAWAMPAGSQELGESILDCLKREVKEETGLDVITATPIAVYSAPRFSITSMEGNLYQPLVIVFLVDSWSGELVQETDETTEARFFGLGELPDIPKLYRETLEDLQKYDGRVILK